jgi:guanylate kinase
MIRDKQSMPFVPQEGSSILQKLSAIQPQVLRLNQNNLQNLKVPTSLIIIGSSWCGKTTIRNLLSKIASPHIFDLPKRFITRERRPNDDLEENDFAENLEHLKTCVDGGVIWKRNLGERVEYYGFKTPREGRFPIYSANNALVGDSDSILQAPDNFSVDKALVLLVHAPDDEREQRRLQRDGSFLDTRPIQKKVRQSDRADSMYEQCHILVDNSNARDLGVQQKQLTLLLNALFTV